MRYILALILFFNLSGIDTPVHAQGNADPELAALQEIYNLTNGGAWVYYYRWNKQHLDDAASPADLVPAEFPGLQIINGHVTKINLYNNANIRGTLPSAEVLNGLTFLTEFSIPGNDQSTIYFNMLGGALPDLTGISSLTKIDFPYNEFTGNIDWITSLSLTSLNLSGNNGASGPLFFNIASVNFSNWTTLTYLNLSFAHLTGTFHSSVGQLDQLTKLVLKGCGLAGSPAGSNSFPVEFGDMQNLRELDLSLNPIIDLPSCIRTLSKLEYFYLTGCNLLTLPNEFEQLDNLTNLFLGENRLGSYPSNFYNMIEILKGCAKLTHLYVPSNSLLDVPSNFSELQPLLYLNFDFNPVASSQMANLANSKITNLDCIECHLTNQLPSTWFQPSMVLTTLNLSNQYVSGGTDRNLLDFNSAGVSQVLLNMESLVSFTANNDAVVPGILPGWLGTSHTKDWTLLNLGSNKIQLPLPSSMSQMVKLNYLNLSNNSLNGVFASSATPINKAFDFTGFNALSSVFLNDNQLVSPIPNFENCNLLQYLDLKNNQFTGDVPEYFQSGVPILNWLNINNNKFTGIPNLASRSNKSSLQLDAGNNYFDFEDLEPLFVGPNMYQLSSIVWTPQKTTNIGLPKTYYVVEGSSNFPIEYSVGTSSHNTYFWQHHNGSGWINASTSYSTGPYKINPVTTSNVGPYRTLIQNAWVTGLTFYGNTVQVNLIPPLCQTPIAQKSGKFKMDKLTGAIVYDRDDCSANIPVICIFGPASGLNNVVTAKAITYSDDWSYSYLGNNAATNQFKTGERGKWRTQASYVADAPLIQSNDKNYNAGTFKYNPFNWKSGERSSYPGWLLSSKVEKYSPDGAAVEERNAIDIPSTAKFGYGGSVPYLIAQNAEYNSVVFESFENKYVAAYEDGFPSGSGTQDKATAHSGKASLMLAGPTTVQVKTISLNNQIKNNGILSRMWIKGVGSIPPSLALTGGVSATQVAHLISRSGEWALYEAVIEPAVFNTSSINTSFAIAIQHTGAESIWMDDVRIQPTNAELTGYVYDTSSLRLLTVFDDQHFGLFYQYSAEGKLTRKIIETEKGLKTLQETQYNTPKVNKPIGN